MCSSTLPYRLAFKPVKFCFFLLLSASYSHPQLSISLRSSSSLHFQLINVFFFFFFFGLPLLVPPTSVLFSPSRSFAFCLLTFPCARIAHLISSKRPRRGTFAFFLSPSILHPSPFSLTPLLHPSIPPTRSLPSASPPSSRRPPCVSSRPDLSLFLLPLPPSLSPLSSAALRIEV